LYAQGNLSTTFGGNLAIGTTVAGKTISLFAGGIYASNVVATVSGSGVSINSTTATTSTTTGALIVAGGHAVGSNLWVGGATTINSSQTSGNDFKVAGVNTTNLIWARPNSTYDAVIVGNTISAGSIINGAGLQINTTDSFLLPVGSTSQRPSSQGYTDTAGMLRYNTTTNNIEFYNGSSWTAPGQVFTVIADAQFTGTGSQTVFTLPSTQTTASCMITINGVLQLPTLAYSVSGTTLTFTEAPANTDVIDVRMLTTTNTVTQLTDTSGYNQFNAVSGTGLQLITGTTAANVQYTITTGGAMVTSSPNVTVATSGLATVVDNLYANAYSSAKYTITATIQGTNIREVSELLMVHNGSAAGAGTATVMSYGRVNTAGNTLVTWGATTTGNIAQLQATTTNANTILRIKRDYMAI
jgi:hypothetical protein